MVETPKKNDPSAEWPEEVKQAYNHLKVPSLYDAVIANEKLSLEIRRQNRELKGMTEGFQLFSTQLATLLKMMEEEWEEYEEEEEEEERESHQNGFKEKQSTGLTDLEIELLKENQLHLQKHAQSILMDTHDDMRELVRQVRQTIHQTLALLPKKEGIIPREPIWFSVAEGMLHHLVEAVERSRYQFLTRLEDIHIELVDPQPGETVNTSLHHIVDRLPGGKEGTIAHVVRVGYRQNQDVLRMAEVTIYQSSEKI